MNKEDNRLKGKKTRREFAKAIAALAATPLIARSVTLNASESRSIVEQSQQPEASPAALALAEVVRNRYGSNLNEEQMKQIRQSLDGRLRAGDRMKQMKLANGDEPAFIFSAD